MKSSSDTWDGYWNPKKRSFGKALIDFMREYYFKWIVLYLVGDVANKTVLEAGCGVCDSLVLLSKKSKKVYGLDQSQDALKISDANFKKNGITSDRYELHVGDINAIPHRDNSFDIVFNAGVIEHFPDTKPIREMIRVTKPSGKVIILVPANGIYKCVFKIVEKLLSKEEISWQEHKFYSKKMMREELLDAGAERIEIFRSLSSLGVYMVGIVRK